MKLTFGDISTEEVGQVYNLFQDLWNRSIILGVGVARPHWCQGCADRQADRMRGALGPAWNPFVNILEAFCEISEATWLHFRSILWELFYFKIKWTTTTYSSKTTTLFLNHANSESCISWWYHSNCIRKSENDWKCLNRADK